MKKNTQKIKINKQLTKKLKGRKNHYVTLDDYDLKERLQNYYECLGCGNCVDADQNRGKCEICGSQKWVAKTTYMRE